MTRPLPLAAGLGTLAAVWLLPLERLVPGAFSAHMTMHMGVVAVAAPLIAYGIAGGALDPVRRAPALFPPIPASVVELLVVWLWHTPALHHAARHSTPAFLVEQGSFLASGLLVWLAAFGGEGPERGGRGASGVIALLLTSMHMTLLGALLALPPRPLYSHHGHGGHAAHSFPLDALDDQHLGGAIMLLAGGLSYLVGGLWLTVELLRHRGRPSSGEPARGAARAGGST